MRIFAILALATILSGCATRVSLEPTPVYVYTPRPAVGLYVEPIPYVAPPPRYYFRPEYRLRHPRYYRPNCGYYGCR